MDKSAVQNAWLAALQWVEWASRLCRGSSPGVIIQAAPSCVEGALLRHMALSDLWLSKKWMCQMRLSSCCEWLEWDFDGCVASADFQSAGWLSIYWNILYNHSPSFHGSSAMILSLVSIQEWFVFAVSFFIFFLSNISELPRGFMEVSSIVTIYIYCQKLNCQDCQTSWWGSIKSRLCHTRVY